MTTEISQDAPVAPKKPPIYLRKWFIVTALFYTFPYGPASLIPTFLAVKSKSFGRVGLVVIFAWAILSHISFFLVGKTSPEQLAKQQGAKVSTPAPSETARTAESSAPLSPPQSAVPASAQPSAGTLSAKDRQSELRKRGCTTLAEFRAAVNGFDNEPNSVKTDATGTKNYGWFWGSPKVVVLMKEREGQVTQINVSFPLDGSKETVAGSMLVAAFADATSEVDFEVNDQLKWMAKNLSTVNANAQFGSAIVAFTDFFRMNDTTYANVGIIHKRRSQ